MEESVRYLSGDGVLGTWGTVDTLEVAMSGRDTLGLTGVVRVVLNDGVGVVSLKTASAAAVRGSNFLPVTLDLGGSG